MSDKIKTSVGSSQSRPAGKFRLVLSLLVAVVALLAFEAFYCFSAPSLDPEQKALAAWEGVRAPDFSVTTIDGRTVHLADLKGKRVILNFWATWCPPCIAEIPDFVKLRADASPTNVFILGLSTDDAAAQKAFAQKSKINYALAVLQNVPSPYQDVDEIPVTMVIDRNGVFQHVVLGRQDSKTLEQFATESDFAGTIKSPPQNPQ